MVRRENPLQSRSSQGYLIAIAHRISYRPGGPDHVFDLSAPPRVAVPAGPGALFPPSAPTNLQLALGVAPRLRRTGQPEGPGPAWPQASGLSTLPAPAVCRVLVHEDLAVVVCRPSPAGVPSTRGWHPVSGGRQYAQGETWPKTPGGSEDAPQPVPSLCLRLSDRAPHGAVGYLSHPRGFRAGPAHRRSQLPARKRALSPDAASVPAPSLVPRGRGHRRCGL